MAPPYHAPCRAGSLLSGKATRLSTALIGFPRLEAYTRADRPSALPVHGVPGRKTASNRFGTGPLAYGAPSVYRV
jgi:hypothetical protein